MLRDDLQPLADLLALHCNSLMRTDVTCARDVYDELVREYGGGQPAGEFLRLPDPASLTGIDVIPFDHYEPGRWKMTRHSDCEFTGGSHPAMAMIVTHKKCPVLGESSQPDEA